MDIHRAKPVCSHPPRLTPRSLHRCSASCAPSDAAASRPSRSRRRSRCRTSCRRSRRRQMRKARRCGRSGWCARRKRQRAAASCLQEVTCSEVTRPQGTLRCTARGRCRGPPRLPRRACHPLPRSAAPRRTRCAHNIRGLPLRGGHAAAPAGQGQVAQATEADVRQPPRASHNAPSTARVADSVAPPTLSPPPLLHPPPLPDAASTGCSSTRLAPASAPGGATQTPAGCAGRVP